jgi:hypothetical protein
MRSAWNNSQKTLCCGFRRTAKAMGQVYQCWWRICRELNAFSSSNITCSMCYIHFCPIYWLSLLYTHTHTSWWRTLAHNDQELPQGTHVCIRSNLILLMYIPAKFWKGH